MSKLFHVVEDSFQNSMYVLFYICLFHCLNICSDGTRKLVVSKRTYALARISTIALSGLIVISYFQLHSPHEVICIVTIILLHLSSTFDWQNFHPFFWKKKKSLFWSKDKVCFSFNSPVATSQLSLIKCFHYPSIPINI